MQIELFAWEFVSSMAIAMLETNFDKELNY